MIQLTEYQKPHANLILEAIKKHGSAVDASDTGTGKTYVAAWVASQLSRPIFVVCPLSVIPCWKSVLDQAGVEPIEVINYEKLVRRKQHRFGRFKGRHWVWNEDLPENTLFIADEFHRAKATDSDTSRFCKSMQGRVLMCSATIASNPVEMRCLLHNLELVDWNAHWSWCLKNGCVKGHFGGLVPRNRSSIMKNMHSILFPVYGSRIRKADLGDAFPENHITADAYDLGDADKIQKIYDEMEQELKAIAERSQFDKKNEDGSVSPLTAQLRARQRIELLKVPGLVQMTKDYVADGNSVVIFVSFTQTIVALSEKLKVDCIIQGGQKPDDRQANIINFQADRERIIIVAIQAGGTGVSLHDLHGNYPRVSLICPSFNAIELIQATGRIHRHGAKSKAEQRIVFAAGTIEEDVCLRVKSKVDNIDTLNDGDLAVSSFTIPDKTDTMETETKETKQDNNQPKHAERAHSRHSPSSWKYKAVCPGWRNDESKDRDTSAADRGTLGHEAVELEKPEICGGDIPLREAVERSLKFLNNLRRSCSKVIKEKRFKILNQSGSADWIGFDKDGITAHLADLKFSYNYYEASGPQFMGYAIGLFDEYPKVQNIKVYAVHPFLGKISHCTYTRTGDYETLVATATSFIARAEKNDPATFETGMQCQYCGKAGECPKLAQLAVNIARKYNPGDLNLPEADLSLDSLNDPATLAQLVNIETIVKKAVSAWRERATSMALAGFEIPGFAVREQKGSRRVTSAVEAWKIVSERGVTVEDFLEGASIGIGHLEEIFAATFPKGKGASKQELEDKLTDANALSNGGVVYQLRPVKQNKTDEEN